MNAKIAIVGIAVVVMLVIAIFVGILPLSIGRVDIEPVTKTNWYIDAVWPQSGKQFVGGYDGTNNKKYELITNPLGSGSGSRSAFLIAKTDYGESEFITAEGRAWYAPGWQQVLIPITNILGAFPSDSAYYRISHKSYGGGWATIFDKGGRKVSWLNVNTEWANGGTKAFYHRLGIFSEMLLLPSITFSVIGHHPGAIKIELVGFIKGNIFDSWHPKVLASDEAELLPSGGSIKRVGTRATYEVGETMEMQVTTDYSGSTVGESSKGYVVKIRNPIGNVEKTIPLQDDFDGKISIYIKDEWYKPDTSGWDNTFKFELVNQMRPLGELTFATIDVIGKAPANCIISTSAESNQGKIQGGETLTVTFTAEEKIGAVPIEEFSYCVFYGQSKNTAEPPSDSPNWIRSWTSINAEKSSDGYTATVSFTVPSRAGYVTIKAWPVGEGNRHSEEMTAGGALIWVDSEPADSQVDQENIESHTDVGGKTSDFIDWLLPGPAELMDYLPLIIAIAVFIICLIIAVIPQIPLPLYGRLIVIVLGAVLAVLIYWYMGGTF